MKTQSLIIGLVIGALAGFILTKLFLDKAHKLVNDNNNLSNISADDNSDTIQWKWADSLDAVKAAPNSHHVIFENDKIRILEVTLLPHTQEPMHTHEWPSVMFGDNNGDTSQFDIIYYHYDYDSINHKYFIKDSFNEHNGGSQQTNDDKGNFMKPEAPHSIKNLSNVKIDVYRVEFKPGSKK